MQAVNIGSMLQNQCTCYNPPFQYNDFTTQVIGIDETNGQFSDVSIDCCKKCNRFWLNYFFEVEGFENSGKWFRGEINHRQIDHITPENALEQLNKLEWHFLGGSYFNSTGFKSTSKINL